MPQLELVSNLALQKNNMLGDEILKRTNSDLPLRVDKAMTAFDFERLSHQLVPMICLSSSEEISLH